MNEAGPLRRSQRIVMTGSLWYEGIPALGGGADPRPPPSASAKEGSETVEEDKLDEEDRKAIKRMIKAVIRCHEIEQVVNK